MAPARPSSTPACWAPSWWPTAWARPRCRPYDQRLCADVSALVLRNRGAGPFGLLNLVDERCGGVFDHIDDVIPADERAAFMARYKAAAGFAIETLNAAPPTIAPGARVAGG